MPFCPLGKFGEVLAVRADLTRLDEVENAKRQILEGFGTVHILVHAAGITGAWQCSGLNT